MPPGRSRPRTRARAIAGELGQHVNCPGDDLMVEPRPGTLVVAGGDLLAEVVVLHGRTLAARPHPRPASSACGVTQARPSPNAGSMARAPRDDRATACSREQPHALRFGVALASCLAPIDRRSGRLRTRISS